MRYISGQLLTVPPVIATLSLVSVFLAGVYFVALAAVAILLTAPHRQHEIKAPA